MCNNIYPYQIKPFLKCLFQSSLVYSLSFYSFYSPPILLPPPLPFPPPPPYCFLSFPSVFFSSLLIITYGVKNYCSRFMLTIIILEMFLVHFLDHNDTNSAYVFKGITGSIFVCPFLCLWLPCFELSPCLSPTW